MPTPIDFPAGIYQTDVTLSLRGAVGVSQSPFSFKRYPQNFLGERWEITIEFLPLRMDEAEIGIVEGFLLEVRHGLQPFRIGDPYASQPQGSASGTATVSGTATAGSNTIATSGWSGTLKCGDYVQIGDSLHRLTSDASGGGSLSVAPSLRAAHTGGTEIKFNNPRGVFVIDSNVTTFERFVASHRGLPAPLVAVESI